MCAGIGCGGQEKGSRGFNLSLVDLLGGGWWVASGGLWVAGAGGGTGGPGGGGRGSGGGGWRGI